MATRSCPFCAEPIQVEAIKCRFCGEAMTAPGPRPARPAPNVVNRDEEHLRLLSIFHYVDAGLSALWGFFPLIYVAFGVLVLSKPDGMSGGKGPPVEMGWLLVAGGVLFALGGWTLALCRFLAGRFLARRTHRMFCLIIAGVDCLFMPLGTILGVFTFVVLLRPSVTELFDRPRI